MERVTPKKRPNKGAQVFIDSALSGMTMHRCTEESAEEYSGDGPLPVFTQLKRGRRMHSSGKQLERGTKATETKCSVWAFPVRWERSINRWFILEGFYTSDSRENPNRQPYDGLHVSLTFQQGNHPTGLTSVLISHATQSPIRSYMSYNYWT
jgi:hypothetical protein